MPPLFYAIAGCVGSWVLVTAAIFQAALELGEQAVNRGALARAKDVVARPAPVVPLWWLLPPIAVAIQQRRSSAYRESVLGVLDESEAGEWVRFSQKASGWFIVAIGGVLIALKETGEVATAVGRPWIYWPIVVGCLVLSTLYTVLRQQLSRRYLESIRERRSARSTSN